MKKINFVFALLEALVFLSGAVYVCVLYVSFENSPYMSAPSEVAFLFFLPFAAAMLVLGIAWLIVRAVRGRKEKRG